MICQLCLENVATRRLTKRSPSDQWVEAFYCDRCYQAKYVEPPADAGRFPTPRFTIKNIIILGGVWAVPNAVAAWVFRSGYITGTPAQIRQWTIDTFLAVNLFLGFFVVWIYLLNWLGRVMWYHKTGNVVPMPGQKLTMRQTMLLIAILIPVILWMVGALYLERWLAPRIWPFQRNNLPLQALLMWAPVILLLIRDRYMREHVRQDWRAASRQERRLRVLALAWSMGLCLLVVFGGQSLLMLGSRIWFPIPPIIVIGICGQMALLAAVAFSTNRR